MKGTSSRISFAHFQTLMTSLLALTVLPKSNPAESLLVIVEYPIPLTEMPRNLPQWKELWKAGLKLLSLCTRNTR